MKGGRGRGKGMVEEGREEGNKKTKPNTRNS
jgi:hypothetical protein